MVDVLPKLTRDFAGATLVLIHTTCADYDVRSRLITCPTKACLSVVALSNG